MSRNWEATQNRHLQLFVCEKENHDNVICEVLTHNGDDAKLLAAAPDLYEALYAAAHSAGFQYMFSGTRDLIEKALAKARGEV